MHKTAAWPLALIYAALVIYASLYPFDGWRPVGIAPWTFLAAPVPRYWTGFDVAANLLGYGPLGFLLALSALRTSPRLPAVLLAALGGGLLSLVMESLQTYLPMRVASNVDLLLNLAGAWLGALMAFALEKAGAIARWSRFRERWFAAHSRGALVLLALWPVALLFPASVPLGLGQVLERAEDALAAWLAETPFPAMGAGARFRAGAVVARRGTAVRDAGRADSVPAGVLHRPLGRPARGVLAVSAIGVGVGVSALSAALSYGPSHAWAWLTLPVQFGLGTALVVALLLVAVPRRACAA
jgi:VanZ family protein